MLGFSDNLAVRLTQDYDVDFKTAKHLAKAYGGRAWDVLEIALKELGPENKDRKIAKGFAYLEAEVIFSIRHDWAVHAEDILCRRTRLAFLNREVAIASIPKIVDLMAAELKWNDHRKKAEIGRCVEFMRHFGGPILNSRSTNMVRMATETDLRQAFNVANHSGNGKLSREDLILVAEMLNHPLSEEEIEDCFDYAINVQQGADRNSKSLDYDAFAKWWNSDRCNPQLSILKETKMATAEQLQGSGTLFG